MRARQSIIRPFTQSADSVFIQHPYGAAGIPSTYVDTGVVSDTGLLLAVHLGPATDRPGGSVPFQYHR